MKKFFLSLFVILSFGAYVLSKNIKGDEIYIAPPETGNKGFPVPTPSTDSKILPSVSPVVRKISGAYKDGVYTGNVADAYYGNVQVRATIQNGKIADMHFLDYPHDRRTSAEINAQAMPQLITEAIQAQNAKVDIVSGATQTSLAFQESLSSALSQAR